MILFFHFLCLLARYIVTSISKSISKRKVQADDQIRDNSLNSEDSDFLKSYGKQSVYEDGTLKFFPPVYVQRYETVALILKDAARKRKIRKVVDFGCAELGFFVYLKNMQGVHEILEVDINSEILERSSFKAAPLTSDYLMSKSSKPLDVYILSGSIADYDDCLVDTDAVVGIELIEHLSEDAFEKMPYNVFSRIKPYLAIFTTPNADFNSLFPNFTDKRHSDHKFEWTRKEFYNWTQEIIKHYPEYFIRFYGIGAGPEGSENLGCCSQMAVFQRSDEAKSFSSAREKLVGFDNYKLIKHYKYPMCVDTRTTEEKILHEVHYQIPHLHAMPTYYSYEENECEIPLSLLKEYVSDLCTDDEEFRNILKKNGMKITKRNNSWFLICSELDFSSYESSMGDDDEPSGEDMISSSKDECGAAFDENWDWKIDEDQNRFGDLSNFQSARSIQEEKSDAAEKRGGDFYADQSAGGFIVPKDTAQPAPESCNELLKQIETAKCVALCCKNKSEDARKLCSAKSRIPRKTPTDIDPESCFAGSPKQCDLSYVRAFPRKMAKSFSLDSCLENINCKPLGSDCYHLNLVGGSVPFYTLSNKNKPLMNDSGSSLFSSSLDKAADSGYPFSFSPPEADLTPEQVEELFSESGVSSRSTSPASELDVGAADLGIALNLFAGEAVVENGDLANNNRDGEGNNVEGLMGQRLVNEVAVERDPNDNMMFFPEVEEFPPWLLNLGDLALRPVYVPALVHNDDEGVGDDSSSDFNRSLDPEDLDLYFESLDMS